MRTDSSKSSRIFSHVCSSFRPFWFSSRERRQTPVAPLLDGSVHRTLQPAARHQLADGLEGAVRVGDVGELEVQLQRFSIEIERNAGLPQAFQLAGEVEAGARLRVVKRLLAEAIAHQQDLLLLRIPDAVREHAAQLVQAVGAFLFIEVDDGFGVAVGAEAMALGDELLAQFLVVVDLAVEDDPDAAVFVGDRLVTGAEIDDAEAAHADAAGPVGVDAFVIRPAMADEVGHGPDVGNLGAAVAQKKSRNPTHGIEKCYH